MPLHTRCYILEAATSACREIYHHVMQLPALGSCKPDDARFGYLCYKRVAVCNKWGGPAVMNLWHDSLGPHMESLQKLRHPAVLYSCPLQFQLGLCKFRDDFKCLLKICLGTAEWLWHHYSKPFQRSCDRQKLLLMQFVALSIRCSCWSVRCVHVFDMDMGSLRIWRIKAFCILVFIYGLKG